MPKAKFLLSVWVALTLVAVGCSVDPEVTMSGTSERGSTQGSASTDSAGSFDSSQSDDPVAASQDAGGAGSNTQSGDGSCNYLGTDSWNDMQIEVVFVSDVDRVADVTVRYSVLDGGGNLVHDSSTVVGQVSPDESLRFHIDTLYEPEGSDSGYACRVDSLTPDRVDENLRPPTAGDSCRFVELDAWDDIQIQLEFTSPIDGEPYVSYALRGPDGVRFVSGYAIPDAASVGDVVIYNEDTVSDVPEWLTESDISCEILGITEF